MQTMSPNPIQVSQSPDDGKRMDELSFLWLEITKKCNLYCAHCYADSGPLRTLYGEMSLDDWLGVLNEAKDIGCQQVQFIGGEPTLHPQLENLIQYADDCGFYLIEVFTNASRLRTDLIECFRRHHVSVATSLYSYDSEVHDRITQRKGSWHRTLTGIQNVIQAGVPLRVGIIEMEYNTGHIPQTISFLHSLGVTKIKTDRQRGVGRSLSVKSEEPIENFEELCGECWKGKLCVTPSGDAYPCIFSRATCIGNVKRRLKKLLRSEKLHNFRHIVRELDLSHENVYAQCPPCNPCEPMYCTPGEGCSPRDERCQPNGSSCGPL